MKNYAKYYIIGGVLLLAGIGAWYYAQFRLAMDYSLDFLKDKTRINKFTIDELNVQTVVAITNKSSLSIELDGLTTNVFLNNLFIVAIKNKVKKIIPANSTVELPLTVNANPRKLLTLDNLKLLVNYFLAEGGIGGMKVRFEGDVSLKTSGIEVKEYPYLVEYKVSELQA